MPSNTTASSADPLRQEFERAAKKVAAASTMKAGGAGAEAAYAKAWDAMAVKGLVPRLRAKYRAP